MLEISVKWHVVYKSLWFLFISVWLKCDRPQNICKTDPALGERIPWRYESTKCRCMVIYFALFIIIVCPIHYHRLSCVAYPFWLPCISMHSSWSLTEHFSPDSSCRLFNTNHTVRPWSCHFHPESDWQRLCVSNSCYH